MSIPDTSRIPTGPVNTEPAGFRVADEQAAVLRDTLTAAGIELGEYERNIVDWLSRWEWATVAIICSWVARAAQASVSEPPVALPGRFDASPADVDQHLRRILAEDTYLRYQQAIGGQAVTEAVRDLREEADPTAPDADLRREVADYLARDRGPYPSQLQCSQHDGFGPCPGAPWCTPKENS